MVSFSLSQITLYCNDVCCSLEFESLSSFQLLKDRIVIIHFSNESLWMKALLEPYPFHSWKQGVVYYLVMLSNSLFLFFCVFEDGSLSLFLSQQYLWHICLFQQKGLSLISNVLLQILQSNEWKWWNALLGWEWPSLSLLNEDRKDMCH